MSTQDPTELVVASFGNIYAAPVGTPLPANETSALNAGFIELGLVDENGVSFEWAPTISEFAAWQSRNPVRREMTAQEITANYALEQWNQENLGLAFGGAQVTPVSAGHYRLDFLSDSASLEEFSQIIDWNDGGRDYRLVLPRVTVNDKATISLQRSKLATVPVSVKALTPASGSIAYLLTNDASFQYAS